MEHIVAAAVCKNGKVYSVPRPGRHCDVISLVGSYVEQNEQGFVTNTGRYVGRVEAAQIAFKAGQLIEEKVKRRGQTIPVPWLDSSDVW
jgi:hypothetical protein